MRRHNFLSFWAIFCPFNTPLSPEWFQKSKFWKNMKIPGDTILLYIHVYHEWRSYDISFLKYKVRETEIFVILGHFLSFQLPDNPENQNFKIEKNTWKYHHLTHLHHKWESYDVSFLRYWVWRTKFFVILDHFLPFYPPLTTQKIKILKKMKKTPEDIIILHKCTINDNHMMYGSWDIKHDGQNFLSFWTIFCPFTPLITWKIKILKKLKKMPWDIIIFQKCTKNHDHILHCSWDMARDDVIIFHFGSFFALLTP